MGGWYKEGTPRSARIYTAAVMAVGTPVSLYCIYRSFTHYDLTWLYLALLVCISSSAPVLVQSRRGDQQSVSFTVTDAFLLCSIPLFGPEVAATLGVLDGLTSNIRCRIYSFPKSVFNLTFVPLPPLLAGCLFYWLYGATPPLPAFRALGMWEFFLYLGLSAIVMFLLNTGGIALAISLSIQEPLRKVWVRDILWFSMPAVAGAPLAGLIFVEFQRINLIATLIAVPIILVVHYAYKSNYQRVQEANRHADELVNLYHSTITSLATAIDAKDQSTHGHLHRVQTLALGLARRSGFTDPSELEGLKAASLLHDIGKLAVPEYILNKPCSLSRWETERMRAHPEVGADILSSVPFPYPVVPFVRCHHELWDGSGYPQGLKGEEIPVGARILAIADCYDALRSDRPYRPKLSVGAALDYMKSQAGKAYDPALVHFLVEHDEELEEEMATAERNLPRGVIKSMREAVAPSVDTPTPSPSTTLFHQVAARQAEVQQVREMSSAFGKSLGLDETLAILAEKIGSLVPCEAFSIYLTEAEEGKLTPRHCEGAQRESLLKNRLDWGEGVTGWVAANRQPLINVSPAPDFPNPSLATDFGACLSVPLCEGDLVLGVITLYASGNRKYDENQLRLMQTVSHYAVSIITNALLFEDEHHEAFTDGLTGLPNARHFQHFASAELKRALRNQYPVTLVTVELENLKGLQDRHGDFAVRQVLVEAAHLLRQEVRRTDICSRRDNQFPLLLPGVGGDIALPTVYRIRKTFEEHQVRFGGAHTIRLEVSVGAATCPEDGSDLGFLMAVAERKLASDRERRLQLRESAAILPFDKREMGR